MDVRAARGDERMLRRVIALLVASAVLAERGADRSAWVRCFVLWILRRAETAAAEFVFEEVGVPPAALEGLDEIAAIGNGREEALRLAARFRALATVLCTLLPLDCLLHRRPARSAFAAGYLKPVATSHPGGWPRRPYDTS